MRIGRWVMVAALALGSGAMAQGSSQQGSSQQKKQAQDFLSRLKQDNQEEISLAKMGQDRAQRSDLKDYAKMLVQDHERLLSQLKQFAKAQGYELKLDKSNEPRSAKLFSDAKQSLVQDMKQASGSQFDYLFLDESLLDHDHDILELTQQRQKLAGTPVASLIDQALPVIRKHRDRAYRLLQQEPATQNQASAQ